METPFTLHEQADFLERLINPPYHSGNIHYRKLSEPDQLEIARYATENSLPQTREKFKVSDPRIKHILSKYCLSPYQRGKQKEVPKVTFTYLKKLLKRNAKGEPVLYSYMGHERYIESYELDAERDQIEVILNTRTTGGIAKQVVYKVNEMARAMQDFVRCG